MTHFLLLILIPVLIGLVVKVALSLFSTTKPFSDPIGVIVAILTFLYMIGVIN